MKIFIFILLSLVFLIGAANCGAENSPPDAESADAPFWAPRGKKNTLNRCGSPAPATDDSDESTWVEMDSTERFYDKLGDIWGTRSKRNSGVVRPAPYENKHQQTVGNWLWKSVIKPSEENQLSSSHNLKLLSAWLRLAEKRNGGYTNGVTEKPFWAARG